MENEHDLEINEKVKLISGGADMILKEFKPDSDGDQHQVVCYWMSDEGQYYERTFPLQVIIASDSRKRILKELERASKK